MPPLANVFPILPIPEKIALPGLIDILFLSSLILTLINSFWGDDPSFNISPNKAVFLDNN
jgi:hypothetical protein